MQILDKSQTNNWGDHAAAPNTHNRVGELILKYLSNPSEVRICDIPCGAGVFSQKLHELGMRVAAMDIAHVEPFRFDVSKRILADANSRLPFNDESFDAVVSIEGIEHLENPSQYLRECARILVAGGLVFLTTPNPDSWRSRRYVLTRGHHRYFHAVNDTVKDSGHLLPIDMVFFRGACARAGLDILETTVNRVQGKNPFTELMRLCFTRRLPAYMRGEVPFYGDVIIYVLRKPEAR